jgi:hypothetical protein
MMSPPLSATAGEEATFPTTVSPEVCLSSAHGETYDELAAAVLFG